MAHELLRDDKGKACIMYVDEVPWHGLGQRHMTPPTAAKAIEAACLNWRVAKTPLFYEAEEKRAARDRECCKVLFENPRNKLSGTANTVWSVYNAVTDYVDHRHSVGNNRALNPFFRLQSIWFGKGDLQEKKGN